MLSYKPYDTGDAREDRKRLFKERSKKKHKASCEKNRNKRRNKNKKK